MAPIVGQRSVRGGWPSTIALRTRRVAIAAAVSVLMVAGVTPAAASSDVPDPAELTRTTTAQQRELVDVSCHFKAGGSSFRGTSRDGKVSGVWRAGISAVDCAIPMEDLRVTTELRRNGTRVASLRWFHCRDGYNAGSDLERVRCDDATTKPGSANHRCADGTSRPCTGRWQIRHHYRLTFHPGADAGFTYPSWCTKSGRTLSCTIRSKVLHIP